MFDVSFSELFVIAVVALLVIGPEKLPKVARTMGAFMGRMQRYVAQVKDEVNREVRFEELQKLQQEIKQSVEQTVAHETQALQASIYQPSSPAKIKSVTKKRVSASGSKGQAAKSGGIKSKTAAPKTAKKSNDTD